jgi:SAM-dependent methyltransferase
MTEPALTLSIVVPVAPEEAFERVVTELEQALACASGGVGLRLEAGPRGRLVELRQENGGDPREVEVARVSRWEPGTSARFSWRVADWGRHRRTAVELECEPAEGGTRVTLTHRGWGQPILSLGAAGGAELLGWFAEEILAPAIRSTAPSGLGEWLTDRRARRPTGPRARETYRHPAEHQEGYTATLEALGLGAEDVLLEVGCGGGAFMSQALASGCRAVAVDHSAEMVSLCAETNAAAVDEGRLEVMLASAERLPFAAGAFTAVAMTHMFFFLADGEAALAEARRTLRPQGRLAVYTVGPELQGTPAAPQPIARQMRFYGDEELERLARAAGFAEAEVDRIRGGQLLRAVA